ncbi:TetR family transcriptional regulator [Paenibacillus sp. FSL H8-457]|nr:TetR family transcriptional regulator [Paenibacillus sp. FSL H8-457]
MLVQQTRTSDGVPEEAKQIIGQNTIGDFSDQLMPL